MLVQRQGGGQKTQAKSPGGLATGLATRPGKHGTHCAPAHCGAAAGQLIGHRCRHCCHRCCRPSWCCIAAAGGVRTRQSPLPPSSLQSGRPRRRLPLALPPRLPPRHRCCLPRLRGLVQGLARPGCGPSLAPARGERQRTGGPGPPACAPPSPPRSECPCCRRLGGERLGGCGECMAAGAGQCNKGAPANTNGSAAGQAQAGLPRWGQALRCRGAGGELPAGGPRDSCRQPDGAQQGAVDQCAHACSKRRRAGQRWFGQKCPPARAASAPAGIQALPSPLPRLTCHVGPAGHLPRLWSQLAHTAQRGKVHAVAAAGRRHGGPAVAAHAHAWHVPHGRPQSVQLGPAAVTCKTH